LSAAVGNGRARSAGEEALEHLTAAMGVLKEANAEDPGIESAFDGCRRAIASRCGLNPSPRPYMPGFLIEVCTNDRFELPVRVMESTKELADYLGCTEERALNTLWCVRKRGLTFVNRGGGRLKIVLVDEREAPAVDARAIQTRMVSQSAK
jgi:hypothetical protein